MQLVSDEMMDFHEEHSLLHEEEDDVDIDIDDDDLTISSEKKSTDENTDEWSFIPPAPVHIPTPALKDDIGHQLVRDEVTTTILPVESSDTMPSPFDKSIQSNDDFATFIENVDKMASTLDKIDTIGGIANEVDVKATLPGGKIKNTSENHPDSTLRNIDPKEESESVHGDTSNTNSIPPTENSINPLDITRNRKYQILLDNVQNFMVKGKTVDKIDNSAGGGEGNEVNDTNTSENPDSTLHNIDTIEDIKEAECIVPVHHDTSNASLIPPTEHSINPPDTTSTRNDKVRKYKILFDNVQNFMKRKDCKMLVFILLTSILAVSFTTNQYIELKQLRQENYQLRQENHSLKQTISDLKDEKSTQSTGWFTQGSDLVKEWASAIVDVNTSELFQTTLQNNESTYLDIWPSEALNAVKNAPSTMASIVGDVFDEVGTSTKDVFVNLGESFSSVSESITSVSEMSVDEVAEKINTVGGTIFEILDSQKYTLLLGALYFKVYEDYLSETF